MEELRKIDAVNAAQSSQFNHVEPAFARLALRDIGSISAELRGDLLLLQARLLAGAAQGLNQPLVDSGVLRFVDAPPFCHLAAR